MATKIIGKLLIISAGILIILGITFISGIKLPFGKLPGDIVIHKENFNFYFPITTCIILSIVISLLLWLLSKK